MARASLPLMLLPFLVLGLPRSAADEDVARIPLTAQTTEIVVDGIRLPLTPLSGLERFGHPSLYIPRGQHRIGLGSAPTRVAVSKGSYAQAYRARRQALAASSDGGRKTLLTELARSFDHPRTPEALHLLGLLHHRAGRTAAAARLYARALWINPAFSPSHLDLALLRFEAGARPDGIRELLLARAFNPIDVFGIDPLIARLAATHQVDLAGRVTLDAAHYLDPRSEPLTELDQRMVRFCLGVTRYLDSDLERAKLLSNLGRHFAQQRKPVRARYWYHRGLSRLARFGRSRASLAAAAVIYGNLARTYPSTDGGQAADYRQMAEIARTRQD